MNINSKCQKDKGKARLVKVGKFNGYGALKDPKDAKIFSKAILHNADRLSEMVTSLIDLSISNGSIFNDLIGVFDIGVWNDFFF